MHALPTDRYSGEKILRLHALVSRLNELLGDARTTDMSWRAAYRENIEEFLDFFNARTPYQRCQCNDGGSRKLKE